MQYSVLGPTGVKVSRICLGTATFGVAPSVQNADRIVGTALDLGINFVDTADVYGNMPVFDRPGAPPAHGRESAEQILGRAPRTPYGYSRPSTTRTLTTEQAVLLCPRDAFCCLGPVQQRRTAWSSGSF
jgi:hypothetical protein